MNMKAIKIKNCEDCPHFYVGTVNKEEARVCGNHDLLDEKPAIVDRVLEKKIPKWCPLEDL